MSSLLTESARLVGKAWPAADINVPIRSVNLFLCRREEPLQSGDDYLDLYDFFAPCQPVETYGLRDNGKNTGNQCCLQQADQPPTFDQGQIPR